MLIMILWGVILGLDYIEIVNFVNVEYMLKINFENYFKGEFFCIMFYDVLGLGIFNVDGSLWKF